MTLFQGLRGGRASCLVFLTISITSPYANAATLRWDNNPEPDIAGYRIYLGETNTTPQRMDAGKTNAFSLAGLAAGKTYRIYVSAYNTANLESDPSQPITYTPPPPSSPRMAVSWEAATIRQLAGYNFYYGLTNASPQKVTLGPVTSTTLTNLQPGTYRFSVAALNNSGAEEQIYPAVTSAVGTTAADVFLARPAAPVSAAFTGRDALSGGSWKGFYGTEGVSVAADANQWPSNSSLAVTAASTLIWQTNSADAAALQRVLASGRVASAWASSNVFDLNLNFTDPYTHLVSLYLLDFDALNRRQTIELRNAASGELLQSNSYTGFQRGTYLSWNVSGNVRFRVQSENGSAVISGAFVDAPVPGRNRPPTVTGIPDQIISYNSSTPGLPFTVSDPEWPANRLRVTASSSNQLLAPNSGLLINGTNGARQLIVTPARDQLGTAVITVTAFDGEFSVSQSFVLNVINQPPIISAIPDQALDEDATSPPLPFIVQDSESGAAQLTVSAATSNSSLIPLTGITFGGSGSNRNVTLKPAANKSGSATITLEINDGRAVVTEAFVVTVRAVNDAPTVSNIRDRTIPPASSTGALAFSIADLETSAKNLAVTAESSNSLLVPDFGIRLAGTNGIRSITITPTPLMTGSAIISVQVSDGILNSTETFTVKVEPGAPTLLLNEGFEPKGYENSGWFEVGTPNEDYATVRLADTQSLRAPGGHQVYRSFTNATNLHLYTQVQWGAWKGEHTILDLMSSDGSPSGFLWASAERTLSIYHGAIRPQDARSFAPALPTTFGWTGPRTNCRPARCHFTSLRLR